MATMTIRTSVAFDPGTTALIGLCTTVAFTHRTRPESTLAEKQITP